MGGRREEKEQRGLASLIKTEALSLLYLQEEVNENRKHKLLNHSICQSIHTRLSRSHYLVNMT